MNKRTTERFRKKLEQERRAIVLSIRRTRLEGSDIEVGANADEADIAMVAHEMGLIFTLHDWALFRLKAITGALHRLETGEWGLCTGCEEPIPKARLNAVPWTTLCVRCQDRDENIKTNKVQNMHTHNYVPRLTRGTRAIFIRKDHPKDGQSCSVLDPLPNPSRRSINQWYDVRFDEVGFLRCHERDLRPIKTEVSAKPAAASSKTEYTPETLKSR